MDASRALRTPSSHHRLLLIVALLGGFALRLWHLGAESLWYDEAVSVWLAQKPLAAMVAHTAGDIHPPGYYFLLHLWQSVAAPSPARGLEFIYAWVSVGAGMAILALLWVVGRRLLGNEAALAGVAVAAVHPFHIWYAQEVRMYTLGGALGLLALWATLRWLESGRRRWLALYVFSAAAGLYVLYYFAFALTAMGVVALLLSPSARRTWAWLAAQVAVGLLFAPWLPVFWRQATSPPVPQWRLPWASSAEVVLALREALAALMIGQTPAGPLWVWALLTVGVVLTALAFVFPRRGLLALLAYILTPIALLFGVSLMGPPIYHVRYLYPFAAPFALVIGAALVGIGRRRRIAGWGAGGVLALLYALSLRAYWFDAPYRADNHRGAVAAVAAAWRPGDVILANAGWITPLLEVYWPRVGDGPAAVPPALGNSVRLLEVAGLVPEADATAAVPLVRSGSVGGDASLGWGNPASDFFAISAEETTAGLAQLQTGYRRLWHYRLYDTVSDPNGVVRAWLDEHSTMARDEPIPGRDYGRIELRDFGYAPVVPHTDFAPIAFDAVVTLQNAAWPAAVAAGHMLYVDLVWEDTATRGSALNMSLRLYDGDGKQVARSDGPLEDVGAVGAPPWLPPGPYALELVVYQQQNGAPLAVTDTRAVDGQRVQLGSVTVTQ